MVEHSYSCGFFHQELLFETSVLFERLPVKFPIATQESLALKAEISCKSILHCYFMLPLPYEPKLNDVISAVPSMC